MDKSILRCKVCFLTLEYPPFVGGVSASAARITGFLHNAGADVFVFTPVKGDGVSYSLDDSHFVIENGINVNRVSFGSMAIT